MGLLLLVGSNPNLIMDNQHSIPANKTARKVISKGVHWDPKEKSLQGVHSRDPLPIKKPIDERQAKLIGRYVGRLCVIGVADIGGKKQALYVVRCVCGTYLHRTSKAINNPNNDIDCCQVCRLLVQRKRYRFYKQTGTDKPLKEFM